MTRDVVRSLHASHTLARQKWRVIVIVFLAKIGAFSMGSRWREGERRRSELEGTRDRKSPYFWNDPAAISGSLSNPKNGAISLNAESDRIWALQWRKSRNRSDFGQSPEIPTISSMTESRAFPLCHR